MNLEFEIWVNMLAGEVCRSPYEEWLCLQVNLLVILQLWNNALLLFHSRTVHLDIIKVLLPSDAQENCFKTSIKIYIKTAPTCFGVITIIRERTIWACWCTSAALFGTSPVPNSATDRHQQGPDNICSHSTRLTTPMYCNWLF